ncbi:MAG: 16S rRNA (cytidine(1402)-2'-O)-methyltransferase [Acidobacteriaceae bacterium]|nr:16S rRNA (cytidine(1402)-2'-O)-methyltransferase [Acidobacteriaceae bacterium]
MSEPAPLAPGLYLVATPIGNLEDITLRALRVLQSVDRIACEDTRQTQKLLNHYQIQKPTISYHQHNERSRSDELVAALQSGQRIAIVSDAGTPGIADPGVEVVAAAIAAGIPVYPIPGANAAISALIASGLSTESFTFHGFLPPKAGQRRTQLESLVLDGTTHIFYEAPHRIVETLEDVAAVFGSQHPVALARELTKLHEEHLRGPVSGVLETLKARDAIRGEFVLLLSGEPPAEESAQAAPASIASTVAALMKQGLSEKDALKQVARDRNLGKSEVYRQWQREKTRR